MKDSTFAKLPQEVLSSSTTVKDEAGFDHSGPTPKSFLESRLRREDMNNLKDELMKRFPLSKERQVFKKRIRRRGCPKSQTLSNTKKRALGLYSIEREGLLYKDLLPLHDMWRCYMEGYLDLRRLRDTGFTGDVGSPQHEEVATLLYKADFHGSFVSVVKSVSPSFVGIGGLLIFETKNTLKLLGKDNITRCIPKSSCEFEIVIGHFRIRFLGKNFLVKGPERSSKKLRGKREFLL